MNRHPEDEAGQKFHDELEAKQRNILWPDTIRNASRVDAFLWKGAPDAPLVQRVVAWLFGLAFLGFGMVVLDLANTIRRGERTVASAIFTAFSVGLFLIGGKICLNGFRRAASVRTKVWIYAALVLFIVVLLPDSAAVAVGALLLLGLGGCLFRCPNCRKPAILYKDTFWPILPGHTCNRCGDPL